MRSPEQRTVALAVTANAGGTDLSARLAKVETAIFRNKTIDFDYYTIERDETSNRRVDPYHLLYKGSQFYLLGHSHERDAIRVFRLSRIRGKVSYASKAEHDFHRPADFDPREYASRADWQLGDEAGQPNPCQRADRLADRAPLRRVRRADRDRRRGDLPDRLTRASGGSPGCSGSGSMPRLLGPPELVDELQERLELIERRHGESPPAPQRPAPAAEHPPRQRITVRAVAATTPTTTASRASRSAPSASRGS